MSHTDLQGLRKLKPYQGNSVLLKKRPGSGKLLQQRYISSSVTDTPAACIVPGVNTASDPVVMHPRIYFREQWAKYGSISTTKGNGTKQRNINTRLRKSC
jgi:hypothetical protein